jgi:tRNA pseudouridine38-40 synthase
MAAVEAPENFHSIQSCIRKEYVYKIHNSRIRDPFLTSRACFFPSPLNVEKMKAAAGFFAGTHDFSAVRNAAANTKTAVRTVHWCEIENCGELIVMRVCANGFLYNMARAIMGTVVYAGLGKLEPQDIPALLENGDRRLAGPTMPPQGLYMSRIWYDGPVGEMMLK